MEISNRYPAPESGVIGPARAQQPPDAPFASMVDAERRQIAGNGTDSAARESDGSASRNEDVEFVREHGILAFVEQNHERKLEELRDEILRNMGLTEQALAGLSGEQRGLIEKMITQEIQERLAAEAAMNGGVETEMSASPLTGASDRPALDLLALQDVTEASNIMAGLAIKDAVSGTSRSDVRDDRDGQYLPGESGLLPDK